MGQQVNRSSKVKSPSESDWTINYFFILYINIIIIIIIYIVMDKLLLLDPKPGDLTKTRL